jgi:hypothetical protein
MPISNLFSVALRGEVTIRWVGSKRVAGSRCCHFLAVDSSNEASCDIADHVGERGVTVVAMDLELFDAQRE